jgi:hypothetical protein
MAFAGRPGGGGDRPFGYEADFMTVRADEADLIRDAAQQLLAGGTIRSILKNWNARGVEGTTGGPMAPQTFRRMMMSARIAGLRSHRGRIVADAAWPAIIDRDTHEKLQRLLTDPTRNRVENPARYLLTGGVATCGRCQLPMSARPADGGRKAYQCIVRTPGGPNCGGMKIDAFGLEAYVGGQILERLGPNTDILSALVDEALEATDRSVILAEIEDLKGRLAELEADYYQQRLVSRTVYLESRSVLDARLDDLRVQLAAQPLILPIAVPDLDLEAWWSEASIEERRGVVAILIDKVRVEPAVRGRNFFDPGRVDIAWRI